MVAIRSGGERKNGKGCPMNPAYRTAVFRCAIGINDIRHPRFAIVTACNPRDRVCSDAENRLADEAMLKELDAKGCWRFRVIGGSPDFQHQEPGWGVATDSMNEAAALGRRWEQAAVFWVDHDALHLVDCSDGGYETLGSWSQRTRFLQPIGSWRVVSE